MKRVIFLCSVGIMICAMFWGIYKSRHFSATDNMVKIEAKEVSLANVEYIFADGEYYSCPPGYDFNFPTYIKQNPKSMFFPFIYLQNNRLDPLIVVDSEDGNVRFYSWETIDDDGENYGMQNMYQIVYAGSVYAYDGVPALSGDMLEPRAIYQLKGKKKDYYFCIFDDSNGDLKKVYYATYEISECQLRPVSLIKKLDGSLTSCLSVECDVYRYSETSTILFRELYHYDTGTCSFYYPTTVADNSVMLSDRYILFKWDGECLAAQKEVGNPFIYEPLQDYEYLELSFYSDSNPCYVLVRIDKMADGSFRYASWSCVGGDVDTEPSMLINNGYFADDRYYFRNKTYSYVLDISTGYPELDVYYSSDTTKLGTLESVYK